LETQRGDECDSTLRNKLEQIVRSWHFTAGKLNGQPATTTTALTVRATLDPNGAGEYRVHHRCAYRRGIQARDRSDVPDICVAHGHMDSLY
jgi:hypothetical protein